MFARFSREFMEDSAKPRASLESEVKGGVPVSATPKEMSEILFHLITTVHQHTLELVTEIESLKATIRKLDGTD